MKSIRIKLIIMYLTLVFLVIIVCGTYMFLRIRFQEFDNLETNLYEFAAYFESHIRANVPIDDIDIADADFQAGLQEDLKTLFISKDTTREMEGNILDTNGNTVYSTSGRIVNYNSSAIIAAMQGSAEFNSNRWGTDMNNLRSEMSEYAYPLTDVWGNVKGIIFVRAKAESIYIRLSETINVLGVTLIIALVMAAALGSLFSGTITAPIRELIKNAKELAEGNLLQEIPVKSNDEIGQLTENFQYMAKEINRSFETITTENNKREILLHTMTDGVLAYDKEGKLIHANQSSQELLGIMDLDAVNFSEITNKLGIEGPGPADINRHMESAAYFGDKYISSVFSPYFNKNNELDGVVVVLSDITKHKKLDDMRQEFVANVSHEIRTPLTTIKSYAETLLDGAVADAEIASEFLTVIDRAADQMSVLVNDLLELTKYDNKQFALKLAEIDLNNLINMCIRQMKPLAQKKNQTIEFAPEIKNVPIEADEDRVTRVFINVIGNSITYSPEGASIKITLDKTEKYYRVYVRDNGIGIPKEDLRRIFERFYRVDKARSRAMGGTGLGLAIAKEIMDAHGGKISATSEPGKGTCMIFRFNRMYNEA